MLELASVGAKVLQTRSVGLAMKEGVRVQVLSSFDSPDQDDLPGTLIVSEEEIEGSGMERQLITGIAHDKNEAKRSEEHTSELQSLMRISYAVFCLKKKKNKTHVHEVNAYKYTKKTKTYIRSQAQEISTQHIQ